jgi:hypothetical protein
MLNNVILQTADNVQQLLIVNHEMQHTLAVVPGVLFRQP